MQRRMLQKRQPEMQKNKANRLHEIVTDVLVSTSVNISWNIIYSSHALT